MNDLEITIADRVRSLYAEHQALMLATSGGPVSPWITGVYFASDDLDPLLLIERAGKAYQNLRESPVVAFSISRNDAAHDFLQARAVARVLPDAEEDAVRARLVAKMPEFRTFTPCVAVRLEVTDLYVSSLASGWFPAKHLTLRALDAA